jgi:hypothetical protein
MTDQSPDPTARPKPATAASGLRQESIQPPPSLVENLLAPDIFAHEGIVEGQMLGNVVIKLVVWKWDASTTPPTKKRVVVGRVMMPVAGANAMAETAYSFVHENHLVKEPDAKDVQ